MFNLKTEVGFAGIQIMGSALRPGRHFPRPRGKSRARGKGSRPVAYRPRRMPGARARPGYARGRACSPTPVFGFDRIFVSSATFRSKISVIYGEVIQLRISFPEAEYPFMASAGDTAVSIRYTRVETRRVTWALALSLAVHLLGWGTYELGKRLDWWELPRWPHWVQQLVKKVEPPPPPPVPVTEPALTFLDVSQESPTAPEKARYYSNKNSRAANQKPEQESNPRRLKLPPWSSITDSCCRRRAKPTRRASTWASPKSPISCQRRRRWLPKPLSELDPGVDQAAER